MDEYASGASDWWHLSRPSPELLEALESGWIHPPGTVLDLGCGLATEIAQLAENGLTACGVDLSAVALRRAMTLHPKLLLARADVRSLPFASGRFDFLLDRGTFHYLGADDRRLYSMEVQRVLRRGGRFLLRACTQSAGAPNGVDERVIRNLFAGWRIESLVQAQIPSGTRSMAALVVRLERD
jgi:SAM-dependent methyltransferase